MHFRHPCIIRNKRNVKWGRDTMLSIEQREAARQFVHRWINKGKVLDPKMLNSGCVNLTPYEIELEDFGFFDDEEESVKK